MNQNPPTIQPAQPAAPITPQPQSDQSQNQPKKSNKQVWIIVALVGCLPLLAIVGILAAMVITSLGSSRDKAKDAQIKSLVNSTATQTEVYFDTKNTYVGFTIDPQAQNQATTYNSKIIVQGLSDKTYVIYAKLPSTDKLFCADANKRNNEITTILPSKTSCQ